MTRLEFRHVALALFSAIGLYIAAILALFVAGLATGFIAKLRTPTRPTPTPALLIRYVDRPTSATLPSAAPPPPPPEPNR